MMSILSPHDRAIEMMQYLHTKAEAAHAAKRPVTLSRLETEDIVTIFADLTGAAPALRATAPAKAGWIQDAAEVYATHVGLMPFGRLGKALKPLKVKYGWETVRPWWVSFCRNHPYQKANGAIWGDDPKDGPHNAPVKNIRFTTPEAFTQTYTFWRDQTQPKGTR